MCNLDVLNIFLHLPSCQQMHLGTTIQLSICLVHFFINVTVNSWTVYLDVQKVWIFQAVVDLQQQKSGNERTTVTTGGAGVEVEWSSYAATGTLVLPSGAVQSALGQGFLLRSVANRTAVNYAIEHSSYIPFRQFSTLSQVTLVLKKLGIWFMIAVM